MRQRIAEEIGRDETRLKEEIDKAVAEALKGALLASELPDLVRSMLEPFTGNATELEAAAIAMVSINKSLGAIAEPLDTFNQYLEELERGPLGALERQGLHVRELADSFDDSLTSIQNLQSGLAEFAASTQQVLGLIESARLGITGSADEARRSLTLSTLSPEQQYAFLDREIVGLLARISASSNPEAIAALSQQGIGSATQAFNLLDESQRAALLDAYVGPSGVIAQIEAAGEARLAQLQEQTITQAQAIQEAVRAGIEAGLATAAANINAAANTIAGSTVHVDVDFTANVPGTSQVYVNEGP
jgi:hypothetical protein